MLSIVDSNCRQKRIANHVRFGKRLKKQCFGEHCNFVSIREYSIVYAHTHPGTHQVDPLKAIKPKHNTESLNRQVPMLKKSL